ncbi:PDZ domain-containing protein [Tepidimicrobium xylanilyticum]|uniref:PDZ domain-containing protein n=3 Tax=Tepidimicrobium xylanilyticum TaxID=1123352 RepID=A0A1H2V0I9_9FIRM|nr:membrane protein [Tepidimicrobium xylanilyticum]SDW61823.1 hypothetical protein SAMN05660923_00982 [Tepidimicrobium xylanilyticum]
MHYLLQIVYYSIYNVFNILKSPLLWVVIGVIYIQYRKYGKMEEGILGCYKVSPFLNVLLSTIYGLIGGILGSILLMYFGITIRAMDFYFILPLALFLSLIHPRFICFSYAGGIISIISLIFGWPEINISEIMFIIGVLHLVESFLILVDGKSSKIPVFMERRGEIVGGFSMNRFWPVPFTILINSGYLHPVTVFAILGYGDFVLSNFPEKKARITASMLSLFSLTLLILARLSREYFIFKYLAAIFSPVAHEIIIKIGRKMEEKDYIFTSVDEGLRVLDTLPKSIGEKIGLNPGDIILALNGCRVYSNRDIETLLFFRPKYIWMEVYDLNKRFVTKEYKDYQNGISHLGIVVVPKIPEQIFIVEESIAPVNKLIKNFKKRRCRNKN